jgi:hypothetical protein
MTEQPFSIGGPGGGCAWLVDCGGKRYWIGRGRSGKTIGPIASTMEMASELGLDEAACEQMEQALENGVAANATKDGVAEEADREEDPASHLFAVVLREPSPFSRNLPPRRCYFSGNGDGAYERSASFELSEAETILQDIKDAERGRKLR